MKHRLLLVALAAIVLALVPARAHAAIPLPVGGALGVGQPPSGRCYPGLATTQSGTAQSLTITCSVPKFECQMSIDANTGTHQGSSTISCSRQVHIDVYYGFDNNTYTESRDNVGSATVSDQAANTPGDHYFGVAWHADDGAGDYADISGSAGYHTG